MLTAKLGDKTINCYDGKHNKETLKSWCAKNIVLCPICNKPYEYCHGEINTSYFRHKDKSECNYSYCEPETEEHMKGKIFLYKWISSQKKVRDIILEGYLPTTKQRPDIMFKMDNTQYVIEYQCSPISSEYVKRHELYQAAGIKDIWICGIEKYNVGDSKARKYLENYVGIFFDVKSEKFIVNGTVIAQNLNINPQVKINDKYVFDAERVTFLNEKLRFDDDLINVLVNKNADYLIKLKSSKITNEQFVSFTNTTNSIFSKIKCDLSGKNNLGDYSLKMYKGNKRYLFYMYLKFNDVTIGKWCFTLDTISVMETYDKYFYNGYWHKSWVTKEKVIINDKSKFIIIFQKMLINYLNKMIGGVELIG